MSAFRADDLEGVFMAVELGENRARSFFAVFDGIDDQLLEFDSNEQVSELHGVKGSLQKGVTEVEREIHSNVLLGGRFGSIAPF